MKFRYLVLAAVICLLPSVSRADSISQIDQFVLTGPSANGVVYTWTWTLPASPDRDPDHNAPGTIGWFGLDVLTEGPLTGNDQQDSGLGRTTSHDLFFYGVANSFSLTCNSSCGQFITPLFASDLFSGSINHPTFLLGNYISLDGKTKLSIIAIPEGPELAMMGIAALGMLGALKKKFATQ